MADNRIYSGRRISGNKYEEIQWVLSAEEKREKRLKRERYLKDHKPEASARVVSDRVYVRPPEIEFEWDKPAPKRAIEGEFKKILKRETFYLTTGI